MAMRSIAMALYSFNRSLVINNARISWPEGSINSINSEDTNLEERGIKRSHETSDILLKKTKHNEQEQFPSNEIQVYKQMLEIMQPSESVAKCIRRLEGGKVGMVAGKRLKIKMKGKQAVADPIKLDKMLKLVNHIHTGSFNVYDETFESILIKIKQADVEDEGVQGDDDFEGQGEDCGQSENNTLKQPSSDKPIHLDYQNSPEEILSLESTSPGSDWSPPNIVQNENEEGEHRIDSLRPNANLRKPGGGSGGSGGLSINSRQNNNTDKQ